MWSRCGLGRARPLRRLRWPRWGRTTTTLVKARLKNLTRPWLLGAAVAVVALSVGTWLVVDRYGGGSFFPGLIAGFLGTFLAFVLALGEAGARERRRAERDAGEIEERRATEVRRRFEPVRAELAKNAKSLHDLVGAFQRGPATFEELRYGFAPLNPQLFEGAWTANAPRLSELVADYELIAALATAYGRTEELRWRLRFRTEHMSTLLDDMTEPLVDELRDEVDHLLERVALQIDQPTVQPLGLVHVKTGQLVAGVRTSATIDTKVIRQAESQANPTLPES